MTTVGVVALGFIAGRTRDASMLRGFTGLDRSSINAAIRELALAVNPVPYSCAGLLLIGICLKRRRVWSAAMVATVMVGAGGSAQVLKHLLARPRIPSFGDGFRIEDIGWPSGHAAAATALAMCCVIVAPQAWRGAVALGAGAFAVALAFATLALTWHYPSEVLGGILLAGVWGSAGLAALAPLEGSDAVTRSLRPPWHVIAAGTVGACFATAVVLAAANSIPLSDGDLLAMAACAFVITILTLAVLVVAVMAAPPDDERRGTDAAQRSPRRPTVGERAPRSAAESVAARSTPRDDFEPANRRQRSSAPTDG
jgi:membrane-associated phospholipid phosphatase